LIRAIAPNLATEGIAAHAICRGTTETGMLSEGVKEFFRKSGVAMQPPEEVADAVVMAATAPLEAAGSCWICNPGEAPLAFEFNHVEGARQRLQRAGPGDRHQVAASEPFRVRISGDLQRSARRIAVVGHRSCSLRTTARNRSTAWAE
jgi:hypothetical protein